MLIGELNMAKKYKPHPKGKRKRYPPNRKPERKNKLEDICAKAVRDALSGLS